MKKEFEEEIRSMMKKTSTQFNSMHQAASMALELYLLTLKIDDANLVEELKSYYLDALKRSNMITVFDNQVDYAIRLSLRDSDLIYEEMHKLFSLCEEIEAMRILGLKINAEKIDRLNDSLRHRFSSQRKMAKAAAHNNVEEWSKGYWWYADNMS